MAMIARRDMDGDKAHQVVAELQGAECRDEHQQHQVDGHALESLPQRVCHGRVCPH